MNKTTVLILFLLFLPGDDALPQPSDRTLHIAIFKHLDQRDYPQAAALLQRMKEQDPRRYSSLPYALVHARTLFFLKKPRESFAIYQSAAEDKRLSPYVVLPLARLAAAEGVANSAVQYYQEYLNHAYPDYITVAQEALEYCWQLKKADLLYTTAQLVQNKSTLDRLAQLYLGRAYVLRGDTSLARNLFLTLIAPQKKKDDVTNLALTELDQLEGNTLSAPEKHRRGRMAFDVWNFDLARKYLEPIATQNMDAAYYYARTMFFLGDHEQSRKTFQVALGLWPDDPMYSQVLYQYANVYFREGNYEKAAEVYKQLKASATGSLEDTAAFKMIYALRAQGKFQEALQALAPYTSSRNLTQRGQALSLRGRIYFQMERYQDAYSQFQTTLELKPYRGHRELLLWKGLTLEKMKRSTEARSVFVSLASGNDFFSHKARERFTSVQKSQGQEGSFVVRFPQMPGVEQEGTILSYYASGNVLPAFLYLRLYDEAAQFLPELDRATWKLLEVNESNRLEKFLAISHLAGLGGSYATATYYSELFLKNLPRSVDLFDLSPEVLKTLFPLPYIDEVRRFSRERELDPLLVLSIMKQESKFKRFARSQAFARGLMQIIPSTANSLASVLGIQDFSVDQLYVPAVNINLGTRYVQDIIKEFGDHVEMVAAGYNGGESNVRRWRDSSIPNELMDFVSSIDFKETKNYVMVVKTNYEVYKRIYGEFTSDRTENSSKQ